VAVLEDLAKALATGTPGQAIGISPERTAVPITAGGASPSPSSATPQPIGAATAGTSADYARGDHVHAAALADLSDVAATAPTSGQVLAWGGSEWAPATPSAGPSPSSATPQPIGAATAGTSADYARGDHVHAAALADLSDVAATAPTSGQVLAWGGSEWAPATPSAGTPSSATPQPIGTAAAGTSTDYARGDHVHAAAVTALSDRFQRLPLQARAQFADPTTRDIQTAIDAHTSGDAAVILAAPGSYPGATVTIGTGQNNLALQGLGATSLGGTITSLSSGRGLSITGTAQRARVIGLQIEGLTTIDSSAAGAVHRFENCQLLGGLSIATPSSAGIVVIYMIGCEFAGPITLTPGTTAALIIDRGIFGSSVTFTNVSAARIQIANSAGLPGTAATYTLNGLISNLSGINTLYVNNTAVTVP
jgi:hypothetical protein